MTIRKGVERSLLGLAVILAVAALLPENWLSAWDIPRNYLLYALALILLFALTRYARIMLILVVVGLVVLVNLESLGVNSGFASGFEMDRGIILLTLGLIILGAGANHFLNLIPTGIDTEVHRSTSSQGVNALLAAIRQGEIDRVERFVNSGVNVNGEVDGVTPLTIAAVNGHLDIARLLLAAGATPDLANGHGDTAWQLAEQAGHTELAELLRSA
ncbi:MAG TPA: ankyrin repeat domain-containing protein [Gammaproteobacteria bacterium]|nr:ankyrin repeat domain-containing protein [Gammaproteobacteria bacterium]